MIRLTNFTIIKRISIPRNPTWVAPFPYQTLYITTVCPIFWRLSAPGKVHPQIVVGYARVCVTVTLPLLRKFSQLTVIRSLECLNKPFGSTDCRRWLCEVPSVRMRRAFKTSPPSVVSGERSLHASCTRFASPFRFFFFRMCLNLAWGLQHKLLWGTLLWPNAKGLKKVTRHYSHFQGNANRDELGEQCGDQWQSPGPPRAFLGSFWRRYKRKRDYHVGQVRETSFPCELQICSHVRG